METSCAAYVGTQTSYHAKRTVASGDLAQWPGRIGKGQKRSEAKRRRGNVQQRKAKT